MKNARVRLTELNQLITTKSQDIQTTSKELDQLSAEIHALKKKSTLLKPYRLQSRLRKAQNVSDHLDKLTKEREETEKKYRKAQRTLTRELDQAIESNRKIANSHTVGWKQRAEAARKLEGLLLQRMNHSTSTLALSLPTNASSLLKGENHQEDSEERLTALRDLAGRMKNQIAALSSELEDARRQQFLRSELTHLIDEESFFAEQGFVRAATTRTEKNTVPDPLAKETTSEGTEIVAVSGTPGETNGDLPPELDMGGSASPELEPTGPDLASIPSGEMTLEPGVLEGSEVAGVEMLQPDIGTPIDVNLMAKIETPSLEPVGTESLHQELNRDPLARLASDFGLPPEQKRNINNRAAPSNGQIQWLENRISTIQWILERLRFKTRELEKQTVRP